MKRFWSIPLMLMLFACQTPKESREELSLAGCWELRLDSTDVTEQVQLPGTTDTNQKGYPNNDKEETTHLSRPFRYQGKAWYQKEITIPENWEGKSIWLILERTKPTQIWVDSIYVGSSDHISTPQEYDLSAYLRAGKHHLTILRLERSAPIIGQFTRLYGIHADKLERYYRRPEIGSPSTIPYPPDTSISTCGSKNGGRKNKAFKSIRANDRSRRSNRDGGFQHRLRAPYPIQ